VNILEKGEDSMKVCPKCGHRLIRYGNRNKRSYLEECSKCDYEFYSAGLKRNLLKSQNEMKEGKYYIWNCPTKWGKCTKSKCKPTICHECSTEQAKRWYKLGKKDKVIDLMRKGLIKP
jgi:hypothetical protein